MTLQQLASFLIGRAFLAATTLSVLLFHPAFQNQAWTQLKVGYSGPLPIDVSADRLRSEFELGEPKQREDLLIRLGVNSTIAHNASASTNETTIQVDGFGSEDRSILFLPCAGPGTPMAHLFLLRSDAKLGWVINDDVPLDCWFQNTTYQVLSIPGRPQQALFAHHVNNGHGSGFVQDDMLLYGLNNGHLVSVLRTAEYKKVKIAGTDRMVEEQSGLLPFPDGSLEETRSTTFIQDGNESPKQLARIERRRWRWDESSLSFTAGEFTTVISRARPSGKARHR